MFAKSKCGHGLAVKLKGMTGIIGALAEELALLLEELQERRDEQQGPFELHLGRLERQQVILARCGVGKVNAAALTQLLISKGAKRLIFTGVAGALAPSLTVGDIVVSTDCVQHDVDATAFDYALGQVPGQPLAWAADEHLKQLALGSARAVDGVQVLEGRVLSGDQFVASPEKSAWLRKTFGGACTEMEGAAVAQVCAKWGVPFVVIRSISDSADDSAEVDFPAFVALAAGRAKQVVRGMLGKLEDGTFLSDKV